jgi:hypothetical protein
VISSDIFSSSARALIGSSSPQRKISMINQDIVESLGKLCASDASNLKRNLEDLRRSRSLGFKDLRQDVESLHFWIVAVRGSRRKLRRYVKGGSL